jgi:hypothetical protein
MLIRLLLALRSGPAFESSIISRALSRTLSRPLIMHRSLRCAAAADLFCSSRTLTALGLADCSCCEENLFARGLGWPDRLLGGSGCDEAGLFASPKRNIRSDQPKGVTGAVSTLPRFREKSRSWRPFCDVIGNHRLSKGSTLRFIQVSDRFVPILLSRQKVVAIETERERGLRTCVGGP